MFSDPAYYEAQTVSLRESLVTMEEFIDTVYNLEHMPDEHLVIKRPEIDKNAPQAYVVPYPYKNSVYSTIVESKQQSDDGFGRLYEDDRTAWVQMIERRVGRILQNRIYEPDLHVLDDNYDVGIILSKIEGRITPFLYSELRGIDLVGLDIKAQSFILKKCAYTFKGNIEEYNSLRYYFDHYPVGYSAWLNLRYNTPNGDYWHYDNDQIYLSIDVPYNNPGMDTVQEYVSASLLAHKKVIALT